MGGVYEGTFAAVEKGDCETEKEREGGDRERD